MRLATERYKYEEFHDLERPQLQFVGSLEAPQLIGTVSSGEVRTTLDLSAREVFFSDLGLWKGFEESWKDPILGPRVKVLIDSWEKANWENHLSRNKAFATHEE